MTQDWTRCPYSPWCLERKVVPRRRKNGWLNHLLLNRWGRVGGCGVGGLVWVGGCGVGGWGVGGWVWGRWVGCGWVWVLRTHTCTTLSPGFDLWWGGKMHSVYNPNSTYRSTLKICRVELCTELFLLSSLPCFYVFADLLSLHLVTFLMLFCSCYYIWCNSSLPYT